MKPRDVVIMGGGLAGAAAATRLAHQGVDVLLLEKEAQPHPKVCGEFLSHEAQHYLEKLDIDLGSLGAVSIDKVKLIHRDQSLNMPLGFQAMSLSRQCLDEVVLNRARHAGAEIKRGVTALPPGPGHDHWRIDCHGHDPITAKNVFLATGKHDLRGWSRRQGKQNDYIGLKMYFKLSPAQQTELAHSVEVTFFNGGYAGLESVENDQANLCLVVSKSTYASVGKNWDSLLQYLKHTTPILAERLADAVPLWEKPLSIFGIPYGFIYQPAADDPAGFYRLGDQMAVIPSLCGDGMAIALHSGFMAADCFLTSNATDYHQRMHSQLKNQIRCATWMSQILATPYLQPFVLPLCRLAPRLVQGFIKQTRVQNVSF